MTLIKVLNFQRGYKLTIWKEVHVYYEVTSQTLLADPLEQLQNLIRIKGLVSCLQKGVEE